MEKLIILLLLTCIILPLNSQTFKSQQMKSARVKTAYKEKEELLNEELKKAGINSLSNYMLLLGFKKEKKLEVWIRKNGDTHYQYFKTYNFCATSGVLGPKRKYGDLQIPEGFYYLSHFNTWSNFYLALKVSYPNQSDRILGEKGNLGGDIYIHGACCTIGCIPLTDDKIKEVYLLAVEAKNAGQSQIPVYLFPGKLDETSFATVSCEYKNQPEKVLFWENLKEGYDYFMLHKKLPKITVDSKGKYHFK